MSMFSFHDKSQFKRNWILWTVMIFMAHFITGLVIVMALNGKLVNHTLAPVFQFLGIFQIIWPEHPLDSLHFLATKSLFAFSHYDPRSGLNLWTLEYDSYTLLVYASLSVLMGWVIATYRQQAISIPYGPAITCGLGVLLAALSISYMTVIDHCSGATWVGFVALYGMGFDEFELYPVYQIICAALGTAGIISGFIWLINIKNRAFA
jgi:hypothetical protein